MRIKTGAAPSLVDADVHPRRRLNVDPLKLPHTGPGTASLAPGPHVAVYALVASVGQTRVDRAEDAVRWQPATMEGLYGARRRLGR